jgi:glucose/mannose-6-phosphate isomerase
MATKNNIDAENMKDVIMNSPDQLIKGLDLAKDIKITGDFKNVIICGIGGSALPANILNSVTLPSVPVFIHRDYNLPSFASQNSLIICISYSGNTEETISALEDAIKRGFKTIGIATGGKVEEICNKNNILLAKIPSGIQPRSATGYLFATLATILYNCGITGDISNEITKTAEELAKINLALEKEGKNLAKKLSKKIPVVYASNKFKAVARIWKIKFNENSKIPSFHNYFPELNHNEMVGYSNIKKTTPLHILIIKDSQDHERTIKRMNLLAGILKKKGVKIDFVETKNGSLMFRVFSSLLLGDWTSYYVAINQKINPTPVLMVEEFKKSLNK